MTIGSSNLLEHIHDGDSPHPVYDPFSISVAIPGFGSVVSIDFEINIPISFPFSVTGWRIYGTPAGSAEFEVYKNDILQFSPDVVVATSSSGSDSFDVVDGDRIKVLIASITTFTTITLLLECER